jgi:hypothetical protein
MDALWQLPLNLVLSRSHFSHWQNNGEYKEHTARCGLTKLLSNKAFATVRCLWINQEGFGGNGSSILGTISGSPRDKENKENTQDNWINLATYSTAMLE